MNRAALIVVGVVSATLTACGPTTPVISAPPPERFQPIAEPAVPAGDTDQDVSAYIISLVDALRAANAKLLWLDDWRKGVTGASHR